ncbi:interleukin-1 beta [Chanos chanos]|uniref:Interleukin-1 n=1 Tax=Chanos chanos TaxID=29144 RepID=A0A6J2UTU1_CHACN|nr:interleukin-1 beta-like [Chanos chanos]
MASNGFDVSLVSQGSDRMELKDCLDCNSAEMVRNFIYCKCRIASVTSGPIRDLHEGLHAEILQQPHNMPQVHEIISALQRMEHDHCPKSTEFSDDALYNIIMEKAVEECVSGPIRDLHEGLHAEILQQPHNMPQVHEIISTLQRMEHDHCPKSTEFSDDALYNIIMEKAVEECVVSNTWSSTKSYTRTGRVVQCTVCDKVQKSLVLNKTIPELQAVILKGGSLDQRVRLNLSSYMAPGPQASQGQPISLSIAGSDLYLSCSKTSENPALQLEVVKDKKALNNIKAQGDLARFLFFRRGTGLSINTFESVKFPGWFISTASEDKTVEMCEKDTPKRIIAFTIQDQIENPKD